MWYCDTCSVNIIPIRKIIDKRDCNLRERILYRCYSAININIFLQLHCIIFPKCVYAVSLLQNNTEVAIPVNISILYIITRIGIVGTRPNGYNKSVPNVKRCISARIPSFCCVASRTAIPKACHKSVRNPYTLLTPFHFSASAIKRVLVSSTSVRSFAGSDG